MKGDLYVNNLAKIQVCVGFQKALGAPLFISGRNEERTRKSDENQVCNESQKHCLAGVSENTRIIV